MIPTYLRRSAQTYNQLIKLRCQRLALENEEIRDRLHRPWYFARWVSQSVVAGIVAAGLLAAWMITYMQPIISRKQEIASLDALIQQKVNESEKIANEARTRVLSSQIETARTEFAKLAQLNRSLRGQQAAAAEQAMKAQRQVAAQEKQLRELSQQTSIAQAERLRLISLANEAQARSVQLGKDIQVLRRDQQASAASAVTIAEALTEASVRGTKWRKSCDQCGDGVDILLAADNSIPGLVDNLEGIGDFYGPQAGTWSVDKNVLTLSWHNGKIEQFTFVSPTQNTVDGVVRGEPNNKLRLTRRPD